MGYGTVPPSSTTNTTMRQIFLPIILLRLSLIVLLLVNNDLSSLLPGLLPAIKSATLDPIHSWDQFAEACFWNRHRGSHDLYESGTRVTVPPLLLMLGKPLCDMPPGYDSFLSAIRPFLVLMADVIGAYCMYRLCTAVVESEEYGEEGEMERRTLRNDDDKDVDADGKDDAWVVPGVLRAERGWIFGLPTKVVARVNVDASDGPSIPQEEADAAGPSFDDNNKLSTGNTSNDGDDTETTADDPGEKTNGHKLNLQETTTNPHQPSPPYPPPILSPHQLPLLTSVLYLLNPITILTASQSLRSLWDMLLLLSLSYATSPIPSIIMDASNPRGHPTGAKCAFCLALASYVDIAYGVFLIPVLLWRGLHRDDGRRLLRRRQCDWKRVGMLFFVYYVALHGMAFGWMGWDGRRYREALVKTVMPNVAFVEVDESGSFAGPSMGLHWYFFVQMFDRFRPYFTTFVSGLPAVFVVPLTIRLYRYPSVLIAVFQLLWAIFRPTATIHTLTLGLIFILLNPRTIVRMRDPSLIAFFALPVPMILFVTFHRMWLVTGNGNPNYIFFQCFAYGLFVAVITLDVVSATVKRDKVRRMVVKGETKKKKASPKEVDGEQKEEAVDEATKPEVSDEIKNTPSETANEPEPVVVFL
eukprot:CCRYP_003281-RA/>CCRYP_003281-RA protein AED:0.10 eAED:0.10 QI:315/1/1/1/1/1/3/44/640